MRESQIILERGKKLENKVVLTQNTYSKYHIKFDLKFLDRFNFSHEHPMSRYSLCVTYFDPQLISFIIFCNFIPF